VANADVTWAYSVELPSIKVAGKPTITAASMKAVLVALADAKNSRTGQCNPKQQVLAQRTALSGATVNRALAGLVQLGLIERQANPVGGGGRAADSYLIHHTNPSLDEVRDMRDSQDTNFAESQDELRNTEVRTSQNENSHLYKEPEENQKESVSDIFDIDEYLSRPANPDGIEFKDFWQLWPRKVAKADALKAWAKATKHTSAKLIYGAADAYAKSVRSTDPKFIAHAATWLNGERWADDDAPLPTVTVSEQQSREARCAREGHAELPDSHYCGRCGINLTEEVA